MRVTTSAILAFMLLASTNTWGASDNYAYLESSRSKYMGVGGRYHGRDCSGLELLWKAKNRTDGSDDLDITLEFRKGSKTITTFTRGLAVFSPDCKYLWYYFSDYRVPDKGEIAIYETGKGSLSKRVQGFYPTWTLEGNTLLMQRNGNGRELWMLNLTSGNESLVLKVSDYWHCPAMGEGISWHPVVPLPNNLVEWTHGIKEFPLDLQVEDRPQGGPAVKLTIDTISKKVIKKEWAGLFCG